MTDNEQLRFGPPRDRRRGKRILTWKNLGFALLAGAVVFALVSIASEMRPEKAGDYGRLFDSRTLPVAAPAARPIVVQEQEIPDQTAGDPMLVNKVPAEEYLGVVRPVTSSVELEPVVAGSTSFPAPERPVVATVRPNERLVLTGGPDGVRLDVQKMR